MTTRIQFAAPRFAPFGLGALAGVFALRAAFYNNQQQTESLTTLSIACLWLGLTEYLIKGSRVVWVTRLMFAVMVMLSVLVWLRFAK